MRPTYDDNCAAPSAATSCTHRAAVNHGGEITRRASFTETVSSDGTRIVTRWGRSYAIEAADEDGFRVRELDTGFLGDGDCIEGALDDADWYVRHLYAHPFALGTSDAVHAVECACRWCEFDRDGFDAALDASAVDGEPAHESKGSSDREAHTQSFATNETDREETSR